MPLSTLTSLMESNCKINDGKGDCFDLAGCPDEVIERFFSFLDPDDQMRMRLNRRLSRIVAESKYYVKRMDLDQLDDNKCVIFNNRRFRVEFIIRIAHKLSIGELVVTLRSAVQFYHEFAELVREFKNIEILELDFEDSGLARETINRILIDSFYMNLYGRCNALFLHCNEYMRFNSISAELLSKVYKSVNDGSESLHKLASNVFIDQVTLNKLLNSLGIAYRNDRVITNKNIEAYKDSSPLLEGGFFVNIFDGFFNIWFLVTEMRRMYAFFNVELHKNLESLNNAKNTPMDEGVVRVRMDVYPE